MKCTAVTESDIGVNTEIDQKLDQRGMSSARSPVHCTQFAYRFLGFVVEENCQRAIEVGVGRLDRNKIVRMQDCSDQAQ